MDSSQRVSGASARSPHDFYVDLDNVVTRSHPMFGKRDPDVRIYASVSQLYVPLPKDSKGVLDRDPIYTEGSSNLGTRHTPRVNLLRLHTNLTHNNGSSSGYSTVALQVPFLPHYYEAEPNNPYAHACLCYEEPHPDSTGTFELVNGTDSLGLVHFFLTDENNRRVRTLPRGVIHITLTLKTESTTRKRKHNEQTAELLREINALTRLSVLQRDALSRRQAISAIQAMREQTSRGDAGEQMDDEDDQGQNIEGRAKKGRKFLAGEQKRSRQGISFDYETGPRGPPGKALPEGTEGASEGDEETREGYGVTEEEEREEDL